MKASVTDVLRSRELLMALVRRDIRVRYKQAVMGLLWAFFLPIMVVLSGLIVRVVIGELGGSGIDRAVVGGLAIKSVPWGFVVGGLGFATNSLVANQNLVTKVYFPREVLPLAALLAQGFDSSVAMAGLLICLPFLGLSLSPGLLWAPVLLVLLFLLILGAGLALSAANIFFRDVRYIVQVLLTFGIFFTPVFFEPDMLGGGGAQLIMLNPVAPLLEGLRLSIIEGHNLLTTLSIESAGTTIVVWRPSYLLYATMSSLLGLLLATRLFRNSVASFAEYA